MLQDITCNDRQLLLFTSEGNRMSDTEMTTETKKRGRKAGSTSKRKKADEATPRRSKIGDQMGLLLALRNLEKQFNAEFNIGFVEGALVVELSY